MPGDDAGEKAAAAKLTGGNGSLRFGVEGMEFLKRLGKQFLLGDRVKVFHDTATGRVGIKKRPDGRFRLGKNAVGRKNETLRLSARDLAGLSAGPTEYCMQESSEFDVVLVPKR